MSVLLQLGSNQGDRLENLNVAIDHISNISSIILKGSIYQTSAWGNTKQPDFYNQIIEIETDIDPFTLMQLLLDIEAKMGRKRKVHWGPRTIDIDILFFYKKIIQTIRLHIPHPRILERKFVLLPLKEHWSKMIHPVYHKTISELYYFCTDSLEVKRIDLE